jgi:hypothetical protein
MRATDAGWEWLDTMPLGASPAIGAFLYGPPRIDGIVRATWPTGAYRIEVLAASGIRHIDVELPDRFEVVPAPAFVPDEMRTGLASPFAPDLGALGRRGLFVVQGGLAVAVPVRPGTALEPAAAWKDTPRVPGGDDTDRVAAIHAPRANGLGYIFEPDATDATAELVRILPADPLVDARLGIGARFDGNDRFPYVILRAPGGLPWGPGIYRMDLAWTDATGPRWASVHMDFRAGQIGPAPTVLGSMRRVAPAAGRDMVAGVAGPEGLPLDLACTGERTGESIVSTDPPVVMGLGHPVGAPPTDVRAERVSDAVAVEQPLLTAREVIPGLTLLAPADGDTFVPGVYRLTVVTEGETRRLTVCAGVTDLD